MLGDIDTRLIQASPQEPLLYLGLDNPVRTVLEGFNGRKYVPLDLSGVERMILVLPVEDSSPTSLALPYVFDSAQLPDVMQWSPSTAVPVWPTGQVAFNLKSYQIPVGSYECQLLVFDSQHPDGQLLIDAERTSLLTLMVRQHVGGAGGTVPPPLPAQGTPVVRHAGEVMSAIRVVYESQGQVFKLSPGTADAPVDALLGITTSAAGSVGATVTVQQGGTIDQPGWSWTEGLVFLGADGTLTQTVPTTGWEVVIGYSPEPTRLNIDIDEPVLLA